MTEVLTVYTKNYFRLGRTLFLRCKPPPDIISKILEIHPWADAIYFYHSVSGESRHPKITFLGGKEKSLIQHRENGVIYIFDIFQTMFSPGNQNLRKILAEEVSENEKLLDMFAAVGNLSLQPSVKKSCHLIAVEKNVHTYKSLLRTLKVNRIHPVAVLNIDSRRLNLENWADRVLMGYHNVDFQHVRSAVKAAKSGAILHLHPIAKHGNYHEWVYLYKIWIQNSGAHSTFLKATHVKKFSPGQSHYMLDFRIEKLVSDNSSEDN